MVDSAMLQPCFGLLRDLPGLPISTVVASGATGRFTSPAILPECPLAGKGLLPLRGMNPYNEPQAGRYIAIFSRTGRKRDPGDRRDSPIFVERKLGQSP